MLANDSLAEVCHANLQSATAGRTFLNVIDGLRHVGISYYRVARVPLPGRYCTPVPGGMQQFHAVPCKMRNWQPWQCTLQIGATCDFTRYLHKNRHRKLVPVRV